MISSYGWLLSKMSVTSKSINGPFFEVFEGDVRGWRDLVEVETVGILGFLVSRFCELLLLVGYYISPLRIYAIKLLLDHLYRILSS